MNTIWIIRILLALLVCCFAWILIRWKDRAQKHFLAKKHSENTFLDPSFLLILGRVCTVGIIVIAALIALQLLGVNVVPLVAFGGIGAAALGFAAKDVIANFFGGLMLYITRPFFIGDYIILPEREIEGHVEEIGWYLTSVRDKEKRSVYLPNSTFSTTLVVNGSRISHRRITEKIGIRYEDFSKMQEIIHAIRQTIHAHPTCDQALPCLVFFDAFKEYFLDIYIDFYSTEINYETFLGIKQEILMRMYEVVTSHGAEIPFPTTRIELSKPQ
jgi:MscS family membrane protein